jgi:hypothetical protein
MPPEQIRNQHLDRQVDVYALGIVFYELLTGQRPFNADTDVSLMHAILFEQPTPAVQLQPSLPEPVLRILERATARDRHERYPDCLAFQAALEEYLLSTGKPVTTGQLAQFIAQLSPPAQEAPLPLLLPTIHGPLTDTALRPAPSPAPNLPSDAPGPSLITDTLIRSAPKEPSLPARREQMRRAGIAGAVLLLVGGGYLISHRSGPPQPALTPVAAAPATNPGDAQAPAQTGAEAPAPAPPPAPVARANQNDTTGILEIEVRPSAIVYLQGKKLGTASPLASVDITPGIYTLKFVNKRLRKTVERPIEVKAGQTTFVLVDLLHDEEAQKP